MEKIKGMGNEWEIGGGVEREKSEPGEEVI